MVFIQVDISEDIVENLLQWLEVVLKLQRVKLKVIQFL